MEELSINEVNNYLTLKAALGQELTKTSQSFIRIGYLLKRARDEEEILKDSGYSDVNEFASAEFGLDRSQVSRFVRINDRFSIGGYSEHLKVEYEQYGSAKLSLMLTLPDEINEELSPEYSKTEINTIKSEYEAEQKISDMEVLMEDTEGIPDEFIAAIVKELNDEHPEPVTNFHDSYEMAQKLNVEPDSMDVKEAFMPDGDRTYSIRIPGQGRFMVNMKEAGITIVNLRALDEKSPLSWDEFYEALKIDMATRTFAAEEEKKPEKKEKPKKVEPSKPKENKYVKEVREFHEREDAAPVQQEGVEQTQDNVAQEDKTEGEENKEAAGPEEKDPVDITHPGLYLKVEPEETIKAVSFNEAHPAAGNVLSVFQTQFLNKLEKIQEEASREKPNWGYVKDHLQDLIRDINIQL